MRKRIVSSWMVMALLMVLLGGMTFGTDLVSASYPDRIIRIIVPSSPGGGFDTTIRQMQPYLEEILGTSIVVDNRPGASLMIGTRLALESEPDGYTFGIGSCPVMVMQCLIPVLGAPYKIEDFDPIANLTVDPATFMVRKDAPWDTLDEFLAYAQEQPPGSINISVSNLFNPQYKATQIMERITGLEFNVVGFDGGGPARDALFGGHVDATMTSGASALPFKEDLKTLAVFEPENKYPDITHHARPAHETLGEEINRSFGTRFFLYAPRGFSEMYPDRLETFTKAIEEIFNNPEFLDKFPLLPEYDGPEVITERFKANAQRFEDALWIWEDME